MKDEVASVEMRLQDAIIKANMKYSCNMRPDASLRTVLGLRGVGELRQIARELEIKYGYRMKREELVETLAEKVPNEDYLINLMMQVTAIQWNVMEDAMINGVLICEIDDVVPFGPLQRSGVLQSYFYEDALHIVVPEEIRKIYKGMEEKNYIVQKHRMNVIDLYAQAAVSLYGAIEVSQLASIMNSQNGTDFTYRDLEKFLAVRSNEDGNYFLYKKLVMDIEYEENPSSINALLKTRAGKSMYLPNRAEFLKYSRPHYYEETPQTIALKNKLAKILGDVIGAETVTNGIHRLCAAEAGVRGISDYINAMDVVFESFEEFQETIQLIMDMNNTTRLWSNYGHTPREMQPLEKQIKNPLPKGPAEFEEEVGRNAPCPCGSGKRSKHCCGKVH